MSLQIVFRAEAQTEFDEAFDWYEQKQAGLGVNFLMCVTEVLEGIKSLPEAYEVVFQGVRRAVVSKFPYLILYKVESNLVVIRKAPIKFLLAEILVLR